MILVQGSLSKHLVKLIYDVVLLGLSRRLNSTSLEEVAYCEIHEWIGSFVLKFVQVLFTSISIGPIVVVNTF